MAIEDIAVAVGISVPSLRKYFLRELNEAAALTKAKVLEALMVKVADGSVPAMKMAWQLLDQGQALAPVSRRRRAEPVEPALGKKASAEIDARTAHEGTEWGDLLH